MIFEKIRSHYEIEKPANLKSSFERDVFRIKAKQRSF